MDAAALWISFFGVAAAVASAVVAWFARADAIKAQEAANSAAERAAAAQERSTLIQESAFNSPPWTFEWWDGDTFLLTNTSSIDALDVTVSTEPESIRPHIGVDQMPTTIGARSAIKIMYAFTMDMPWIKDLIVTWRREAGGQLYTWRFPLPSRPKV